MRGTKMAKAARHAVLMAYWSNPSNISCSWIVATSLDLSSPRMNFRRCWKTCLIKKSKTIPLRLVLLRVQHLIGSHCFRCSCYIPLLGTCSVSEISYQQTSWFKVNDSIFRKCQIISNEMQISLATIFPQRCRCSLWVCHPGRRKNWRKLWAIYQIPPKTRSCDSEGWGHLGVTCLGVQWNNYSELSVLPLWSVANRYRMATRGMGTCDTAWLSYSNGVSWASLLITPMTSSWHDFCRFFQWFLKVLWLALQVSEALDSPSHAKGTQAGQRNQPILAGLRMNASSL